MLQYKPDESNGTLFDHKIFNILTVIHAKNVTKKELLEKQTSFVRSSVEKQSVLETKRSCQKLNSPWARFRLHSYQINLTYFWLKYSERSSHHDVTRTKRDRKKKTWPYARTFCDRFRRSADEGVFGLEDKGWKGSERRVRWPRLPALWLIRLLILRLQNLPRRVLVGSLCDRPRHPWNNSIFISVAVSRHLNVNTATVRICMRIPAKSISW